MTILLNEILNLPDLGNSKIRFVTSNGKDNPIAIFKEDRKRLFEWQFWNYKKGKSFRLNQVAIGLVRIEGDRWLLFDISRITKDLNRLSGVGYEYETLNEYEKYFGRIIIHYKNRSQQMVRKAESVIHDCVVQQILEDTFDDDVFPGYENVNLSWADLKRVLTKSIWKTALENQKGVYLITDKSNGQMYVGSAYGTTMLYGRWSSYVRTGHGGNVELKRDECDFNHIKEHFQYSILDIFKSTIDDDVIIKREQWWKNTLMTRKFGYNKN
ncbi:MAG: GIY-YIG nuclease family protein [Acidobacteria bacterium]|nr:GIY-YIG nuclease family protein [Acidobacteriota bacterium]